MWKKSVIGLAMVGAGVLVVSALYAAEQERNRGEPAVQLAQAPPRPRRLARPVETPSVIEPGEGNQRTRLQIELFQLICERDNSFSLDVSDLSEADPAQILQVLEKFGDVELVTRLDDQFDARGTLSLRSGGRVPRVSNVAVNAKGDVSPSVSYEDVGTVLEVRGAWGDDPDDWADLQLNLECSFAGPAFVIPGVADGTSLPTFNQFRINKMLRLRGGHPVLMLSSQQPLAHDGGRIPMLFVRVTATRLGD